MKMYAQCGVAVRVVCLAGNILGVFLTPLLLFQALDCDAFALPYGAVLAKLGWKVLLPVGVGQLLRAQVPSLRDFRTRRKGAFGKASEACLLAVIYATFCEAFAKVSRIFVGFSL